jgi:orotate phosphoribosyltransferase
MLPAWTSLIELAGAALILLAFWANTSGRWPREGAAYLWTNLLGAVLLGVMAAWRRAPGFVLLEIAWIAISLASLRHPHATPQPLPIKDATMADERARLLHLVESLALSRGHFILASGRESSYYLDGRMVTLSPEGAYLTGKLMFAQARELGIEAVGGLTMGADPIAASIAVVSHLAGAPLPAFIVRKDVKGHGKQKQVEGPLPEKARVAIVEDTITTGDSALKAAVAVEALGCTVVAVLALVDRLEGGRETIEGAGYQFLPLFTIRDLGIE